MKEIYGGLQPTPKDERDYSLGAVFGKAEFPPNVDFMVSMPLVIHDQQNSDMCVAFSTSAVSEDEEGVQLSPEWFFAKIKEREGSSTTWGANLRDAMKVATKKGFLKQLDAPYSLDTNTRDWLADWTHWPLELDDYARVHKKKSYFKISQSGYIDLFDAIRASLWQFKGKNQSIITGLLWCPEWTNAEGGIIRKVGTPSFGHAFKIFGQRMINGEPFLIAQLSNGEDIGDKGIFYISREAINGASEFGAYMLVDMEKNDAEILIKHNWTINKMWLVKIINYFKKLFA